MKKRNQYSVGNLRTPQTHHCFVPERAPEYGSGNGRVVDGVGKLNCKQ